MAPVRRGAGGANGDKHKRREPPRLKFIKALPILNSGLLMAGGGPRREAGVPWVFV